MKKEYEMPEISVILFNEDVITSSTCSEETEEGA